ncbi:hypothetical protein [Amphritea sp. HPY]|uniref:hypothetical protein n=1 Tax=Amphritea sp. HPY TaxID=3421652 RepID=UPI003D7CBB7F
MKAIILLAVAATLSLSGCNAANVQPQPVELPAPVAAVQDNSAQQAQQFETLNSRITLLQEQVLGLKVQNAAVAEKAQLLLNQFQVLAQNIGREGVKQESENSPQQLELLLSRLDRQLVELQQAAPDLGVGNPFLLATCYTAKGKWKLIRYNRFSGESWISADTNWQPLNEELTPAISSYEVQLLRANGDVKGYVAARIDQNTGDTWWLSGETWVKYQH